MDAIEVYESLRKPVSGAELERLAGRLRTHLDAVEEAALSNPDVDLDLAGRIVEALQSLVRAQPQLSSEQRACVRGALDYFLLTADAANDLTVPKGLVDDAQVLNHVCHEVDRPDLAIDAL